MTFAIEVRDLRKSYDDTVAVEGVSFAVESGECVGVLGPNGAGKTTTLEMIEGLREPDGGSATVLGLSSWPRNTGLLRQIGVQLQSTAFIPALSAVEQLRTIADLYGAPRERAEELLEIIGLTDKADTDATGLSGGQQQRLSIALALVHNPAVVFLDEPSTGLDPSARRDLWELIDRLRTKDTTVVLTTHYMEEAEVLCDRVAIMDHGQILAMDSPAALVRGLDAPTRILLPPHSIDTTTATSLPGVESVKDGTDALILTTREPARLLTELAQSGGLDGLQVQSATLEDVFVALTGRQLHAGDQESEADPSSSESSDAR